MCATCDGIAERAYFAGLLDGEGYVGIRTVRHAGGYTSFAVQVTITNVVRAPLEEGRSRWGGSIHKTMARNRVRPIYKWQLTARMAAVFLSDTFAFLRIKAAQAEIAMQLQERIDAIQDRRTRTPGENAVRLSLQARCRELNARGFNGEYVQPNLRVVAGGCATCGCLQPENAHGDKNNILVSQLKTSATKTRVAPGNMATALRNVRRTLKVAGRRKRK